MGLKEHAERELRLAGLFDADGDYGGAIGPAVMALVELFASQGHSGGSAAIVLAAFGRLSRHRALTAITSNADEWTNVTEMSGEPLWQNKRQSSTFSHDGGKTWFDVSVSES